MTTQCKTRLQEKDLFPFSTTTVNQLFLKTFLIIYLYSEVAWYSYTLGKLTVVIKRSVKYVPEMSE